MSVVTRALIIAASMTFATMGEAAIAAESDLTVEAVSNVWGTPYQVELRRVDKGAVVSGRLAPSTVTSGKRVSGQVWAQVVDQQGTLLSTFYGRPKRANPAKYNQKAIFTIAIEELPATAVGIRVGYR